jgi:hypothetical protein
VLTEGAIREALLETLDQAQAMPWTSRSLFLAAPRHRGGLTPQAVVSQCAWSRPEQDAFGFEPACPIAVASELIAASDGAIIALVSTHGEQFHTACRRQAAISSGCCWAGQLHVATW